MTPTPFQKLVVAMLKCEQSPGQSVYQHGVSVNRHFEDLITVLSQGGNDPDWKLPDWAITYADDIIKNIHPSEITSVYLVYHDAGKPHCRVEENGKTHFPDHAAVSKRVFLEAGGDPVIANLIGSDMDIHTLSSDEIKKKCESEWTVKDACTLLLAALSEIHSNAKMFGGINSTSFKIKWKQLDRRGKQVCKHFFKEQESERERTFEECH